MFLFNMLCFCWKNRSQL